MTEYVLQHQGLYNLYTTDTGKFAFEIGVSREQLINYRWRRDGPDAIRPTIADLDHAELDGTSSYRCRSPLIFKDVLNGIFRSQGTGTP